jgi:nucleoside-diphosphate-sugar epimerase
MATVLIAGCGYLGTALGLRLAAVGHEVYGLRRSPHLLPAPIVPIAADLQEIASLPALPPVDFIFYTAGAAARTEAAYRAAYVDGLRNVMSVASGWTIPPRRIFFTSSTGVYHQDQGEWVDESSPAAPTTFSGRILLEGEGVLRESSWPHTIVRFAGIYGPGRTGLIDSVRNGTAACVQGPPRYLNHLHRDDCAGILQHLMAHPQPQPLYIGVDDAPVERCELLHWVAARLEMPPPPTRVDAPTPTRGGNRRYANALLKGSGYHFQYPTYREGYADLLFR